jgi:hypothetical protein
MTDSEVEQVDVLLVELERIAQHHSLVGANGRRSTELKRFTIQPEVIETWQQLSTAARTGSEAEGYRLLAEYLGAETLHCIIHQPNGSLRTPESDSVPWDHSASTYGRPCKAQAEVEPLQKDSCLGIAFRMAQLSTYTE